MKSRNVRGALAVGPVVLVMLSAPTARATSPHWSIQPSPNRPSQEDILEGVSCAATSRCEAVGGWFTGGEVPFLLAEGWDGKKWSLQTVPRPRGAAYALFYGVSCPSSTACVAVGDDSSGMMGADWNGARWSIEPPTFPQDAYSSVLKGVSCLSATMCTAVGWYSTVLTDGELRDFSLAERWDGSSWTIQPTPNPAGSMGSELSGVSCTSMTSCIAVGSYQGPSSTAFALSDAWNGTRWSIQTVPDPSDSAGTALDSVSCPAASSCTAVGAGPSGRNLVERYDGSWAIQKSLSPSPGIDYLAGVSCPSSAMCMAAGEAQASSVSASPFAERRSGPRQWSLEDTPVPAGAAETLLQSISCSGRAACTAVGYYPAATGVVTLAERYSG